MEGEVLSITFHFISGKYMLVTLCPQNKQDQSYMINALQILLCIAFIFINKYKIENNTKDTHLNLLLF